jgi:hypothetical protein
MNIKIIYQYILICTFSLLIINHCKSEIFPKAKVKIDSLYPNATIGNMWMKSPHDNTQDIEIKCNCQEFSGRMIITFDTNGNLLNKDMYVNSLKNLPDSILSYIKKNISETNRIDNGYMVKSINNKGEVNYSIQMLKRSTNAYQATEWYIIKFKSNGEFISKEKIPEDGL